MSLSVSTGRGSAAVKQYCPKQTPIDAQNLKSTFAPLWDYSPLAGGCATFLIMWAQRLTIKVQCVIYDLIYVCFFVFFSTGERLIQCRKLINVYNRSTIKVRHLVPPVWML